MHGSKLLVSVLEDTGVDCAFGLAGSTNLGILDEIAKSKIKFYTTRHEQVATGMATGYALATRKPTAAVVHVGPGAANMILGMASAYRENVPVVAITGNEPSYNLGRNVKHEWDVLQVFERITKYNVRMGRENTHDQIRDAVTQSVTGIPGPVHIDVPHNLENETFPDLDENLRKKTRSHEYIASMNRCRPSPEKLDQVIGLLSKAKRPLIIAGSETRWFDSSNELKILAEKMQIPVANTHNARGALSEEHPLSIGLVGWIGLKPTNGYLENSDLIIAIGASLSDYTTSDWKRINPDASIVHITMRPRELNRQYVADVNVMADSTSAIVDLNDKLAISKKNISFKDISSVARKEYEDARNSIFNVKETRGESGVDPAPILHLLDGFAGDYSFVTGGGIHAKFARHLPVTSINGHFGTLNFSGMSQGLPLAMGAQIALDEQVFVFEGDGGFAMVMQDLETAVRESIPVKIIIFNNDAYMSQTVRQHRAYEGRTTGSVFKNPDFAAFARDLGMFGESIEDSSQIKDTIERFVEVKGPALIDAHVDPWIGTEFLNAELNK
jgi:acetolactate synthase-1/2/3 large subunit|tara:strand:+ start:7552 stop:9222 length:1671 start_codon:yes stop_codon:yes gene_type:complete